MKSSLSLSQAFWRGRGRRRRKRRKRRKMNDYSVNDSEFKHGASGVLKDLRILFSFLSLSLSISTNTKLNSPFFSGKWNDAIIAAPARSDDNNLCGHLCAPYYTQPNHHRVARKMEAQSEHIHIVAYMFLHIWRRLACSVGA